MFQRRPPRVRIDRLLVDRGLAASRERAQRLVLAGAVLVEAESVLPGPKGNVETFLLLRRP